MTVFRLIDRIIANRRGGILTLTAVILPTILLITALSVDLGVLYLAKSKASMAATAAAEAAEQRLPDISSADNLARQVALASLHDAGFISNYEIRTDFQGGAVTVEVELRTRTVLARFADIDFLDTIGQAQRSSP